MASESTDQGAEQQDARSSGATTTVPIVIDIGEPPPFSYVNALQIQVAPNEVFLIWGCAPPPTNQGSEVTAVHAEYVARLVISPALLDAFIAQLQNASGAYRAIQEILQAERGESTDV